MARATRGRRLTNGVIELKTQAPGGMRKIRCPFCKNLAMAQRSAQGKAIVKCSCGRVFSSQQI